MKVTEHLQNTKDFAVSFEVIPPIRGGSVDKTLRLIEELSVYKPPFIDITSHSANLELIESDDGIQKIVRRKRPGTMGICALIQHKFGIDAIPHVLCKGFTEQETEDFLIELNYLGIDNVMALRGDDAIETDSKRPVNTYASDLVAQINNMNCGKYARLESASPTNFCIGVAGYPEQHIESPNVVRDIIRTNNKIDAGADYVVTQMFFNNKYFFNLKNKISAPIIPGIKIITNVKQIYNLPKTFHCEIPEELIKLIEANPHKVEDIGVDWACKQIENLRKHGVNLIHLYVMQNASAVHKLMELL